MTALASRSSLISALVRTTAHSPDPDRQEPNQRQALLDLLCGLSRDELECLAEFQGAIVLEESIGPHNPYRLMADFFDPVLTDRWHNPSDRAHKTFIVLAYLDCIEHPACVS